MSRKLMTVAGVLALAGTALAAAPAQADPAFTVKTTDVIGVGSDTTMLAVTAIADGATVGGVKVPGYNEGRTTGRIASWDALVGGNSPTISLYSGAPAIPRPNGSGAGKALLYGPGNNPDVDFARSSSSLNDAEKNAGLQQIPFALDALESASAKTTNVPANLTIDQIVKIYKGEVQDWAQVGGMPGTIVPLIPQTGSGTRSFFLGELKKANGGVDVTLAASVKETQEHSDVDVKSNPNAIVPFSVGRAKLAGTVKLHTGWRAERAVYNVVRGTELGTYTGTGVFGSAGFVCSPQAKLLIEAGGLEQLAVAPNGVCGEPTQAATTDFRTNTATVRATTTTLSAVRSGNNAATLKATVAAGGAAAQGAVKFYDGSKYLATLTITQGTASLKKSGLTATKHTFKAVYVPTAGTNFTGSTGSKALAVKTGSTVAYTGDRTISRLAYAKFAIKVRRTDSTTVRPQGNLYVYKNGVKIKSYTLDVWGNRNISIPPTTKAARYLVKVSYAGSTYVNPSSASFYVTTS
ncbi:substrate-binding domain-containing protein [Janibacter sp. G56]|uniref:substrate-binding domain-containing protein n=1 Tax=Janibacter sp. G56 TaxID=3418717 RepID=UPI003D03D7C5